MTDLDLRKLRYFLVLSEELNFGRAAERLHIAQPVLSRQIAVLEDQLGATLFERSTLGTALTVSGALIVDDVRELLMLSEGLQRKIKQSSGTDKLTIGFMPGVVVTTVVREMRSRFPDLSIDVIRTSWYTQVAFLLDGTVDVSFIRMPVPVQGLTVIPLFTEPRVAVLPADHPLLDHQVLSMSDLAALDLLQDPAAVPEWREAVLAVRPDALAGLDDLPTARTVEEKLEHVAAGRGVVVLPESTSRFYPRPDIVYRPVDNIAPATIALAHRSRPAGRYVEELIAIACQQLQATDQE